MPTASPAVRSLALACALCVAGPAAAQAAPAAKETVFDFRPRIVLPADAAPQPPRDDLSWQRYVHLHVFEQAQGAKDCNGDARTPVDGDHVGVVLSGGISKGLAFIGALEVVDRVGIRVDKIAGTSMGAVVGAFYAAGYSPTQLYAGAGAPAGGADADILSGINWRTLFTDIPDARSLTMNQQISWGLGEGSTALPRVYQGGLRSGQNLSTFLGKYLLAATAAANGCFDNLYVPFRAKATNVSNSASRTLYKDDLATAVRASLSFPVLLTPTYIEGSRHIDGGILNNYPVDAILERTEAPPADTPPEPDRRYRAILGFDVSDTSTPPLAEAQLFQFASAYGALSGLQDGIGAAISRETERLLKAQDACDAAPGPASPKPCLMHFKFTRPGGFTDFSKSQIEAFVSNGRLVTIIGLCLRFVPTLRERCEALSTDAGQKSWAALPADERTAFERLAIEQIRAGILARAVWRFLLHDPRRTLDRAKERLDQTGERAGTLDAVRALRDRMGAEGSEPAAAEAGGAWPAVLQGLQLTLHADGRLELQQSDALRGDAAARRQALGDIRRTLDWLTRQLAQPVCGAPPCTPSALEDLPDFREVAGVRVVRRNGSVSARALTWKYRLRGLIAGNGLTVRGALDRARVDYWGLDDAARAAHLQLLESRFCSTLTTRLDGCDDKDKPRHREARFEADGSTALLLSSAETPPVPGRASRWKREIVAELGDQPLDVRYFRSRGASDGSLPLRFEGLQERYYSNAAAEYFRIEDIRADRLEIAEKDTSRTPFGSIFGSYQYDYRNKHTFGVRYVYETREGHWIKPTRVVASALANEPFADDKGMHLLDAKFLYFPSIRSVPADFSLNPYTARRNQRIGYRLPRFEYDDAGLVVIASWRPPTVVARQANYITPYLSFSVRRLGDADATDLAAVRRLLRDPGLGEERRRFGSVSVGGRAAQYLERVSLLEQFQFALHRGNGGTHSDTMLDLATEIPIDGSADGALVGVRLFLGRLQGSAKPDPADASAAPPLDELYSLGGYYPLAERNVWGRKRIDYLGADLNARWGTRLYLCEARYSLARWTPVTYFAPYAKVQLDVVLQRASIGFQNDPSRRWRSAAGLVGSVYLPSLSSVKPRLSAGVGGESRHDTRFFSSVEVLF